MFERLGKIESVMLGIEDHGILTCSLTFNFGGSVQSFGGYSLHSFDEEEKERVEHAAGTDFILCILKACGVNNWEDIKGKVMYALYDSERYGQIMGIRALPFEEGGTFLISEWQKRWFSEK